MRGGFTFRGVDIADLGLEYAPDISNTYVFDEAEYKISEQSFDGHHGGYYYGSTVQPKVFTLRCYFEEKHVNKGVMTKIGRLFERGVSGRLVFAKRPWVWYMATVVVKPQLQMTNYENGLVTLQLKAYYPFGRCDDLGCDDLDETMEGATALINTTKVPAVEAVTDGETLTEQKTILLYNGGTERAAVAIELAGDVDEGVTIANSTTGQKCHFVALSNAATSSVGKYLVCDGMNGKTILTNGTKSELAFLYHDYGFIDLEPAYPIRRNIQASYTAGSTEVYCEGGAGTTGQYIWLDGSWRQIMLSDEVSLTVLPVPENSGSEETEIVTMNEITITPDSTMALTRLNFRYKPTFE